MRDITLCHPRLQEKARLLVEECGKQGLKIQVGETLRTVTEQDALYALGRTKVGVIVTNARGSTYRSMHQWGVAFDIYRNDGKGGYNDTDGFFGKVGKIGKSIGLEWGGDWKSITDQPHFQLPDWGSTPDLLIRQYQTPPAFFKTWKQPVGWVLVGDRYWYNRADGTYPANQWAIVNHHWYLFDQDGYLCTGWHRWDGKVCDPEGGGGDWFFLDSTVRGPLTGACWHSRENGAQEIWYVEEENRI